MLAAVETAITARLSGGAVDSYSIGGRNLRYMSLLELFKIRDQLKSEVGAALGGSTNRIAFGEPT